MDLMFGAHFAKQYVNNYLKVDIPTRIINYRNGWNLDDVALPTPVSFFIYEPIALDSWPTIITVAMSTNRMERIGYSGANPLYRVNYSMRTYVWVRDVGSEEATLMRDRLTTVVRSALLDYPCMKATDPQDTFKAMIDESGMQEQFSDLTLLKGDRVMAGAYLSYDLSIDEVVDRLPLGTVSTIDLELSTLDRTP
jgi:hypothetical protein